MYDHDVRKKQKNKNVSQSERNNGGKVMRFSFCVCLYSSTRYGGSRAAGFSFYIICWLVAVERITT